MALTTRVTNDYLNWTVGAAWELYDSNTKVKIVSGDDVETVADSLERSFVLANKAVAATISVQFFIDIGQHGPEAEAQISIILVKPDLSEVTLYNYFGEASWETFVDLTFEDQLLVGGTYKLRLEGMAVSGFVAPVTYYHSQVHFGNITLAVDTDLPAEVTNLVGHPENSTSVHLTWDAAANADTYKVYYKKTTDAIWSTITGITDLFRIVASLDSAIMYDFTVVGVNTGGEGEAADTIQMRSLGTVTQALSDTITPTEDFVKYRSKTITFSETITPTEDLSISHITGVPINTAILLCGHTGSKVYTFTLGTPAGIYDTPEVDFGYPDKEKTLKEIRFGSEAAISHTILVYVSINGGTTWLLIGSDTTYLGKTGHVYPWLTSKRFLVRFSGSGLHLYFYELYAIPSGWNVKTP